MARAGRLPDARRVAGDLRAQPLGRPRRPLAGQVRHRAGRLAEHGAAPRRPPAGRLPRLRAAVGQTPRQSWDVGGYLRLGCAHNEPELRIVAVPAWLPQLP